MVQSHPSHYPWGGDAAGVVSYGCALVSGSSFPKKELLEPGSRWQLSPSRPGSTGTSPSRAARSRPTLRPGQFITPVPPGMAGHGAATSLTAHPSAPQTLGTGGSSAPSPAPRQGAMSPAHTIVTPHVIYSAEVPLGSPPCPASIPLMGTVAVENSGSGGMQPHRAIWGCWQCHTLCHGDKPWWHLPG